MSSTLKYADNLSSIDADKPVRVSIFAYLDALSQIYGNKLPVKLNDGNAARPVVVQLVQDISQQLFGTAIKIEDIDKAVRLCVRQSSEKFTKENPPPMSDDQMTWNALHVVFDHLVTAGDRNPDAIQLDLGSDTTLSRRISTSARARINSTVELFDSPGMEKWQ
jgi:hypothetical protein